MNSAEKQAVLHCLKSMIDEEVCEECPLYGTTGTDHCEKDCVRLAINVLEQEPREDVCEWFEQSIDIVTDDVKFRFSDGTVKRAKLGLYMCDIEKSLRKMLIDQMANKIKQEPCTDAISRQTIQTELKNCEVVDVRNENDDLVGYYNADTVDSIVRNLPPVTPAEKVGQWRHYEGMLICSECGAEFYDDIMEYCGDDVPKYCPDCGAKMQEVKNE